MAKIIEFPLSEQQKKIIPNRAGVAVTSAAIMEPADTSKRLERTLTQLRRVVSRSYGKAARKIAPQKKKQAQPDKGVPLSRLKGIFTIDDPRKTQIVRIDYKRLNEIIAEEK